jgi:hypothetical protein
VELKESDNKVDFDSFSIYQWFRELNQCWMRVFNESIYNVLNVNCKVN